MKKINSHTKNNGYTFHLIFLVILVLFGLFNIAQLYSTKNSINNQINLAIEDSKPAQISLTIIDIDKEECPKCIEITKVVKLITDTQKTNVTKFVNKNYKDQDIQSKIEELGITKFPALIIEGNINQSGFLVKNIKQITTKVRDGVYVFMPLEAPYLNNTGDLLGEVNLIALYNKDCLNCTDVNFLIDEINNSLIQISNVSKIDINSLEGKNLVSKYNIDKVPTLLFSNELKEYNSIVSSWESGVGTIENDGTYVLRSINPIYYSITENRVVGKIKMTILSNENCKNCFNGSEIYSTIMGKIQIPKFEMVSFDVTSQEGVDLINKYKLKKFPMIIVEGDTEIYPNLKQVWGQVGSIEDNKYIFRNVELLQAPYYDINIGEVTPSLN